MNSVSGTQAELPHRARFSLLLFTSLAVAVGGFFCILILHPDRPLALSLMLGSRGAVAANFAYAYSPALTCRLDEIGLSPLREKVAVVPARGAICTLLGDLVDTLHRHLLARPH